MDPKELLVRLNGKLDKNYKDFVNDWLKLEPSMLIQQAEEIADTKRVYDMLKDGGYDLAYLEYLLRFENPLEVVRDKWTEEQSLPVQDQEMSHVLWSLMDQRYTEGSYPLDEDYAPPAMEITSQGGMC